MKTLITYFKQKRARKQRINSLSQMNKYFVQWSNIEIKAKIRERK
jgi:hypothetical protein